MTASTCLPSSREKALLQLEAFVPQMRSYGAKRNFVQPGHHNVSRISGAVRHRLLHETEIVHAALTHHGLKAAEKFVQEVCWRTYWKGWLELRPQVWQDYLEGLDRERENLSEAQSEALESLVSCQSGIGIIDAFTQELITTGYLHNHARMWWASYWIHGAQLPWRMGAAFFLQYLIDADAASNTLSWRWVAGIQTPGKTYQITADNIRKFAQLPDDVLEKGLHRLETIEPTRHEETVDRSPSSLQPLPTELPAQRLPYLWVADADDLTPELSFESLVSESTRQNAASPWPDAPSVLVILCASAAQDTLSPAVASWRSAAFQDAQRRLSKAFTTDVLLVPSLDQLVECVATIQPKSILGYKPFVGSVDWPDAIRSAYHSEIEVVLLRRLWDHQLFPMARAGFFPFWQKASKLLNVA